MLVSLYNLKNLIISVKFINHLAWLLWLIIFNLPTLIIINLIRDYINNDYLIIITTFIIIIFSTIIAVITFFGPEKKLIFEIFKRIKKF